jgi:hypothetical protein
LKINLRIEYLSGESKEIVCSASDLVKFEEKFNLSISKLDEDMKFTHLLFLAWSSESRNKQTEKDFDAWVELVSSVGAGSDPK